MHGQQNVKKYAEYLQQCATFFQAINIPSKLVHNTKQLTAVTPYDYCNKCRSYTGIAQGQISLDVTCRRATFRRLGSSL